MPPRNFLSGNTSMLHRATSRASSLFGVDEDRAYRELELVQIRPNPNQPRKRFDQMEIEALTASIEQHGLLQPIIVREVEADRYDIIAGERRFRAVQELGRTTIPAIVLRVDASRALPLVENVQRVDLHALELAEGLHQLIDEEGLTQAQAGLLIGKSQEHVARLLGLLKLPEWIRAEASAQPQVSTSMLLEIGEIGDPDLQATVWNQAKAGLTIRGLRDIKKQTGPENPRRPTQAPEVFRTLARTVSSFEQLRERGGAVPDQFRDDLRRLRTLINDLLGE
jgi:ParB family chromosome partitioning protein